MSDDKVQIGLGQDADNALKALVDQGIFPNEGVGYKFGVAYALSLGTTPEEVEIIGNKTKFAVAGLDPDGRLSILITTFLPDSDRPYWAAEKLADWGLRDLARRLAAHEDLAEIMEQAVL
ncbi:hypothetical protein [Pengzhenrongella frigida]|uniref:Uncharacterized protein n=1 Tax=Pengzhenrongella frigida TaxID=1259133 RepID=A0A4Q5MZ56_9MICO|nr:hypothetical protein [Cellulomonas sp. HLT2-17]RYV50990.1 hypothetical protein EUA98_10810 [Cellulomonas sp. HLT2-17]